MREANEEFDDLQDTKIILGNLPEISEKKQSL
jgi:hypothetical protein